MNGLEKITARIEADERGEIEQILRTAEEKAESIRTAAEDLLSEQLRSGHEQNAAAAESRRERLVSAAQMEARQTLLGAKQDCIDEAFRLAQEKLLGDSAVLTETLAAYAAKEAETGREELLFSPALKASIGEAVVRRANALREGAAFTLSDETRDTDGVILRSGNVEINGSLSTRFRLLRERIAYEIADTLFEH